MCRDTQTYSIVAISAQCRCGNATASASRSLDLGDFLRDLIAHGWRGIDQDDMTVTTFTSGEAEIELNADCPACVAVIVAAIRAVDEKIGARMNQLIAETMGIPSRLIDHPCEQREARILPAGSSKPVRGFERSVSSKLTVQQD